MLSQNDAAYLAGLLDGEGCIGVRPRSDGYITLELGICMTTPAPLQWAQNTTGFGGLYLRPETRKNRRDAWFWKVGTCHEIALVLVDVLPYLKVKAAEARAFLVLAHLRTLKRSSTGPVLYREAEHAIARVVKACKALDDKTAYEEALDLACYLRQAILERDA